MKIDNFEFKFNNMKHTNKIAIKVLTEEYDDYKNNPENEWHYDSEYKMIVKALDLYEKLNKYYVSGSVCAVCSKKFVDVKKCYNVKCTNPFQTNL